MSRGATLSPASRTGLSASYWRQWTASAVSNLGDGICFVAMPLLALASTDDERLLSLVTVATLLPWLLLALPVGVLVDRVDRRLLLVGSDVARFALFALVAVVASADGPVSIWLLLGALLVIGAFEVVFDSTAQAFVPMLVRPHDLRRANGYLVAAEVVAGSMIGLSLGAFLFDAADGLPFAVNAASFAVAAALVAGIREVTPVPRPIAAGHGGITAGVRWLRDDELLRTLASLLAVSMFGLMLGQGVFVKYAADELGLGSAGYGVLLACAAVGAAAGGLVGHRTVRRIGTRAAIVLPYVLMSAGHVVLAALPVAAVVAVAGFVTGAAITVWNVVTVSLRQQLVAPERFGRVNSVYRWLGTGAGALGALAGGQLAYAAGLRSTYAAAGAVTLVALGVLWPALRRGVRQLGATPAPPSIT